MIKIFKIILFLFLFIEFFYLIFSQETGINSEVYQKKIFFVIEDSKGFYQICVMDSDGKNKKILTKIGNNWCPTVSPKGDKIAFYSDRSKFVNLWLMNTDGTQQKQLTFNNEDINIIDLRNRGQISWNLDNEEIYFLNNNNICKIDKNGDSLSNITNTHDINSFMLSPDGKKWLFSRQKTKFHNGLWTMNYNTSGILQIVESNIFNPIFDWGINNQIIYLHNRGLSIINYDGTNNKLILNLNNLDNDISWSKFDNLRPENNYIAFINDDHNIWIMSINNNFKKQITKNNGYSPVWLDKESLLYIEKNDIYLTNINNMKKQRLTYYIKSYYPIVADIVTTNIDKNRDSNNNE